MNSSILEFFFLVWGNVFIVGLDFWELFGIVGVFGCFGVFGVVGIFFGVKVWDFFFKFLLCFLLIFLFLL